MLLIPLIRTTRSISACLIYPEHPVQAIAISEFISVIGPLLNPKLFPKIIGTIYAIMFNPYFAHYFIKTYHDINTIYNQAEICTSLLFIAIIVTNNYL
tara:strand:- start:345 stop:638 length:294 start_codon:yes stop_codon:yes gene_type:complete